MGAIPTVFRTPAGEQAVHAAELALLDEWPRPNQRHHLSTRQGPTFVVECGPKAAPAVVLLHGTAACSAMWTDEASAWSRRFRVFAVDIIGDAGLSAPVRPPLDSDAHALWLDDVLAGLALHRVALVGISFGGWLALDYATRRPDRVHGVVATNPGGVGRPRHVLLWALPLLMLGPWGRRQMMRRIAGQPPTHPTHRQAAIGRLGELIFAHFRPRTQALPAITDAALAQLNMPVLAIIGGRDVFIDPHDTRRRLSARVAKLTVAFLPQAHHFVPDQAQTIEAFLASACAPG